MNNRPVALVAISVLNLGLLIATLIWLLMNLGELAAFLNADRPDYAASVADAAASQDTVRLEFAAKALLEDSMLLANEMVQAYERFKLTGYLLLVAIFVALSGLLLQLRALRKAPG